MGSDQTLAHSIVSMCGMRVNYSCRCRNRFNAPANNNSRAQINERKVQCAERVIRALNKTLTFRALARTHPSCRSASKIHPMLCVMPHPMYSVYVRFHRITRSSGLLFYVSLPSDRRSTTIIIIFLWSDPSIVRSAWNNERVWKCLIKSNKSQCDLFVRFFFSRFEKCLALGWKEFSYHPRCATH